MQSGSFPFSNSTFSELGSIANESEILLICNPNNPTGTSIDENQIRELAKDHRGPIVIDEAYIEYSPNRSILPLIKLHSNIIVLRTFSKAWGRPDLRLGAIIGSSCLIKKMSLIQPPFQISQYAISQLSKMLNNSKKVFEAIRKVKRERTFVQDALSAFDQITFWNSDSNFICCKSREPSKVIDALNAQNIKVANFTYNTETFFRVTIKNRTTNKLFLDTIKPSCI